MKTFYLFRHAETKKEGEHYTKEDIISAQILKEGVPPIKRMAKFLKNCPIDAWYVSEYLRCQQTADIISSITKTKFTKDKRLGEFHPRYLPEPFYRFRKRIADFLKMILKSNHHDIVICTHGAVVSGFKHFLTGKEFKRNNIYDDLDTGVITIVKNNSVEVINFSN